MPREKGATAFRKYVAMKQSKEKDLSLSFRGMLQKVKHSTPIEASKLSRNASSLGGLINSSSYLSPVPKKSFEPSQSFEERPPRPKAWNSRGLRELSTLSDPSEDPSTSSQVLFPRRRLSTIIGSEESSEVLNQSVSLPVTPSTRTRRSEASYSKSKVGTTEQTSKWQGTTSLKETAKRKKRNHDKELVERRVRQWELRQLKNIEEATTHELTVEEV